MSVTTPRPPGDSSPAGGDGPDPTDGLIKINQRPEFGQYLRDLWARREFIIQVPLEDVRARNQNTFLGMAWLVLTPLLTIGVYFVIFGLLLNISRGLDNYIGFLAVGYLMYNFIGRGVPSGARIIPSNISLIQSVHFPRAALPISSALQDFFTFIPAMYVMLVVVLLSGLPTSVPNESVRWQWILMLPIILMALMMVIGLKMIVARLGNALPDLGQVLPHIMRMIFYGSGVIYEPTRFTQNHEWVETLFNFNPFFEILSLARNVILADYPIDNRLWIYAALWSVGLMVGGTVFFWRGELNYGF